MRAAQYASNTPSYMNLNGQEIDDLTGVEERPEYVFKNGAKYRGQWKGEHRHGRGEQIWQDGARYEGDWRYNKAHG